MADQTLKLFQENTNVNAMQANPIVRSAYCMCLLQNVPCINTSAENWCVKFLFSFSSLQARCYVYNFPFACFSKNSRLPLSHIPRLRKLDVTTQPVKRGAHRLFRFQETGMLSDPEMCVCVCCDHEFLMSMATKRQGCSANRVFIRSQRKGEQRGFQPALPASV